MSDNNYPNPNLILMETIEAPELAAGYGSNVEETFDNIDKNFNNLANSELWQGDQGEGLISVPVEWSEVLGDSTFDVEVDEIIYTFNSQKTNVENALKSLKGVSTESNDGDVDAIINQLKSNASFKVILMFKSSTNQASAEITSIVPYVIIDERFRSINGTGSDLSEDTDMSCVLTYNNILENDNPWTAARAFPYLEYNAEEGGGLYWVINGNSTSIPASGPNGLPGKNAKVYLGIFDAEGGDKIPTGESFINIQIKRLYKLNNGSGNWEDVSEGVSAWGDDGSTIILFPYDFSAETAKPENYFSNYYYFSTVYKQETDSKLYLYSQINIWNQYLFTFDSSLLKRILIGINTIPNNTLKGIFLPLLTYTTTDRKAYMAWVDGSNHLNISQVNDIDDPSANNNGKIILNDDIYINGINDYEGTEESVIENNTIQKYTKYIENIKVSDIASGKTIGDLVRREKYKESPLVLINESNTQNTLTITQNGTPTYIDFQYSLDGDSWEEVTFVDNSFEQVFSDRIYLKRELASGSIVDYHQISCSNNYSVAGNIMSFINGGDLTDNSMYGCDCIGLFENTPVVDASKLILPATTLAERCYDSMFYGCTGLTQAPELPATTLAQNCYSSMFYGCNSLTSAPELPATTLAESCYGGMFSGCTSLTQAPELPTTILASGCYSNMFSGCTRLTQTPELPATTLAEVCYQSMFSGCTRLTQAPELPATTLAESCYGGMFSGCTSLNSVTCWATALAYNSTYGWLYNVSPTGIFTGTSTANWQAGASGIPNGWTKVIYNVTVTQPTQP